MKTFRLLCLTTFLSLPVAAVADPVTVTFHGTAGMCEAGPLCNDFIQPVQHGDPFNGSFTIDNGVVSDFSVSFPNITLTATNSVLTTQLFDGREQWAAVTGEILGGYMSIGLTTFDPRFDLLQPGVIWDCGQWGFCGFQIKRSNFPAILAGILEPAAVTAWDNHLLGLPDFDRLNGTLTFDVPARQRRRGHLPGHEPRAHLRQPSH